VIKYSDDIDPDELEEELSGLNSEKAKAAHFLHSYTNVIDIEIKGEDDTYIAVLTLFGSEFEISANELVEYIMKIIREILR